MNATTRTAAPRRTGWWASGAPWVWLNAGAVGVALAAVIGLVGLIAARGLAHFWPAEVLQIVYEDGPRTVSVIGELVAVEFVDPAAAAEGPAGGDAAVQALERRLIKTGNRRVNAPDFRWIDAAAIVSEDRPADLAVFERLEWGNAYGRLRGLYEGNVRVAADADAEVWTSLQQRLERVDVLRAEIAELQASTIDSIHYALEELRLERRRRALEGAELGDIPWRERSLHEDYERVAARLLDLVEDVDRDAVEIEIMDGRTVRLRLGDILRAWRPNAMSTFDRILHYAASLGAFLTDEPREANTEGGVFPAIFGTVMMVLLMSVLVTPFGVIAAVYLHEYARQGVFVRLIRIAVNNLAGVPGIVYGVFGLGLFVYFVGGTIDDIFYPETRPAPTFGTPGLIWASLTLALLTVPVVIVSTEEGLARIPRAIREGSLALGATKAETLFRVILPIASPSILTGVILAVARAAGEVAPLMLVGVAKLVPALPVDGNPPFIHLDRKFMHLGFHIYDVGFQSPNVEAARPLVYATALLLILIVVVLNLTAILLRNRLEGRYRFTEG